MCVREKEIEILCTVRLKQYMIVNLNFVSALMEKSFKSNADLLAELNLSTGPLAARKHARDVHLTSIFLHLKPLINMQSIGDKVDAIADEQVILK